MKFKKKVEEKHEVKPSDPKNQENEEKGAKN